MDSASADGISLETVGPHNLTECGIGCVTNPRHEGFAPKVAWLRKRFEEGLRFLLFRDADGRPLAFLEYVPGEYAWRPVDAPGWLFVQCLWVYPRGQKVGGLGTRLIRACLAEARRAGKIGVAAMVSEGPWMAGRQVFERSEFERVAQADRFELLVRKLGRGRLPAFRDVEAHRSTDGGLHLVYSAQCPYLPKSVHDLRAVADEHGVALRVTELDTPEKAQRAPSFYGVFSLLWNGRLLSDHYVSATRFRSILLKHVNDRGR
jgi:hypothetical protein